MVRGKTYDYHTQSRNNNCLWVHCTLYEGVERVDRGQSDIRVAIPYLALCIAWQKSECKISLVSVPAGTKLLKSPLSNGSQLIDVIIQIFKMT